MATTLLTPKHHHSANLAMIPIKREPMEENMREYGEVAYDMQATDGRMEPTRHMGTAPPMTLSYNPYSNQYDQRAVSHYAGYAPPHVYPQQREEPRIIPEKQSKEFSNYILQSNNMPPLIASDPNTVEAANAELVSDSSFLKMKRSNGKLAVPEILRTDVTKNIDLLSLSTHQRAKREFVPDNKKDECYWTKRVKNNDSARRSRVKRKALEKIMETRLMELQQENIELRHEMSVLKNKFGITDEMIAASAGSGSSTYGSLKASLECVLGNPNSPPAKLSKDDELEQQSSASDDSRSLDDSRSSYNVRSESVLSQSLDPSNRDRADSMGSSSSGSVNPSPDSISSPVNCYYNYMRTDKSGALDLTSDFSTRSTYSRDFTSSANVVGANLVNPNVVSESDSLPYCEDSSMRAFPPKCRFKYSASSARSATDSSGTFPGA